ncbi:unnamed protein product [Symbiodinium natans]|uniref:Uncharacterized protein n=1 Tax=Symbiodinium natans TaxID=878477 RepID=A0A812NA97_9DINO|nr:unnamed protein product [Symbiodinium natans]
MAPKGRGSKASKSSGDMTKTLWNALYYEPKAEDEEVKSFRCEKLLEFRAAGEDRKRSMIAEFMQNGKKMKAWHASVSESVKEMSEAKEGSIEGWADKDGIMQAYHLSWQDPNLEQKLSWLTEGLPVRDHRNANYAKAGYKEWYFSKETLKEVSATTQHAKELRADSSLGSLTVSRKPAAVANVSQARQDFAALMKEAARVDREVHAELAKHREVERDAELAGDIPEMVELAKLKEDLETAQGRFDQVIMTSKRFLDFSEQQAAEHTTSLSTSVQSVQEVCQRYHNQKNTVVRAVGRKRLTAARVSMDGTLTSIRAAQASVHAEVMAAAGCHGCHPGNISRDLCRKLVPLLASRPAFEVPCEVSTKEPQSGRMRLASESQHILLPHEILADVCSSLEAERLLGLSKGEQFWKDFEESGAMQDRPELVEARATETQFLLAGLPKACTTTATWDPVYEAVVRSLECLYYGDISAMGDTYDRRRCKQLPPKAVVLVVWQHHKKHFVPYFELSNCDTVETSQRSMCEVLAGDMEALANVWQLPCHASASVLRRV